MLGKRCPPPSRNLLFLPYEPRITADNNLINLLKNIQISQFSAYKNNNYINIKKREICNDSIIVYRPKLNCSWMAKIFW